MAFVLPGRPVCSLPTTAFLGALATLLAVDEEQVVRRVVVGLAIAVLQDQHLHPAEPTGQVPPALGGRLRPQPAGRRLGQIAGHAIGSMRLPLRIVFTTSLRRLSSGDRNSTALSSAAPRKAE
jgi:hypothetical protein